MCVIGIVLLMPMPPVFRFLKYTLGGDLYHSTTIGHMHHISTLQLCSAQRSREPNPCVILSLLLREQTESVQYAAYV